MKSKIKSAGQAAFEKVFGNVNVHATKRTDTITMRVGKTDRDKVKGHVPYVKNRRIKDPRTKEFVKV